MVEETKNPLETKSGRNKPREDGQQVLNIQNYHEGPHETREIRRLAEIDPKLAYKVIEENAKVNVLLHVSSRFGMVTALLVLAMILGTCLLIVLKVGLFQTLSAGFLILAFALLVRVILTGEWSETTWVGKIIGVVAKAMGANNTSPKDDETAPD